MSFECEMLPAEPFSEWMRALVDRYGSAEAAHRCQLNDRQVRRNASGEPTTVGFGFVDRVLTCEGSTFIWELYPQFAPSEDGQPTHAWCKACKEEVPALGDQCGWCDGPLSAVEAVA